MKKLAPSFLAAALWQAANQVAAVEQAGCEYLHLDIMDGHFVPNISFGPGLVKCLRPHSKMVFDTHLMVEDPDFFFEDFAAAGADIITVHAEACRHLDRSLHRIHDLGLQAVSYTHLEIACQEGSVWITMVQPEGKARMSVADFVRGYQIQIGGKF